MERCEGLQGEAADAAARLARLAFDDFYSLFTRDDARILAALREQFAGLSELNNLIAARADGAVAGIACFYPVQEMQARQMEGLRSLLRIADDPGRSGHALREFKRNFPPPSDSGCYVSRFVVSPSLQGSGLAQRLLDVVRAQGHAALELHVRRDNARAIAFYSRNGFQRTGDDERQYLLLRSEPARA